MKMGLSKTEINLKRLLAAAPHQQNKIKLTHVPFFDNVAYRHVIILRAIKCHLHTSYIATLREQLEQVGLERTSEGLPRVSKALVNDYSEKIEAIAAKLVSPVSDGLVFRELRVDTSFNENISKKEEETITSPGLRRRLVPSSAEQRGHEFSESSDSSPVKLDAAAQAHITKHRKLQEDLTDEMVVLARQLRESSLMMNKSIQNTERILDSTEQAIEHSLASTGQANTHATAVHKESFKTSCFTWFMMFVMTCIFVMVILLIKVT